MKRFIASALLVLLTAAPSLAVVKENCGCGLGTELLKDQDGLVFELLAVSTNGISGNQTLGITSGTLGCEQVTLAKVDRIENFIAANLDNVVVDMASGRGESLDAIAEIAGLDADQKAAFLVSVQRNFDAICPTADVDSHTVSRGITAILAG